VITITWDITWTRVYHGERGCTIVKHESRMQQWN